jgi:hypothetical protein
MLVASGGIDSAPVRRSRWGTLPPSGTPIGRV